MACRRAFGMVAALFLVVCVAFGADDSFSWRQAAGQTLRVMLNRHPYAEGIIGRIRGFERLTGIKVAYAMYPPGRYRRELDDSFSDPSAMTDVYMTDVGRMWEYVPQNRMLPLDAFIVNPAKTRQSYNALDFFPRVSGAFRWNGRAGSGTGEGVLWAVPIGFEVGAVVYNREILSRYRKRPPASMEELLETGGMLNHFGGRDTRGVAVCGLGEWSAAHSGYFTAYVNYGATDFEIEDGRLSSRVNSPEAIAVTDLWVRMLRECAPADWEEYDWRRCLGDLSDRRVAMLCDSNVIGYYADSPGASSLPGSFGVAPPPVPPGADPGGIRSNLWAWGLAINPESRRQDAAWLFVQYFTSREFQLWSVLEWKSLNPPRRSVFEDPAFQTAVASMHGYVETFSRLIENTRVYFTPNPYFLEICEQWALTVQGIVNGGYRDTEEGMNALKAWMDNKVSTVRVE